jgi:hypothetical protein
MHMSTRTGTNVYQPDRRFGVGRRGAVLAIPGLGFALILLMVRLPVRCHGADDCGAPIRSSVRTANRRKRP